MRVKNKDIINCISLILYQSYKEGTFPKGEIIQIESEDQVVENKLCYIIADSKYILPNRELTDEEILEYIDFNKKIDYSLSQQEEIKKENKERAEHQKVIRQEIKQEVTGNGSITEQEAISKAERLISEVFLTNVKEYYKCHHHVIKNEEDIRYGYAIYYESEKIDGDHFYLRYNAENGKLMQLDHVGIKDKKEIGGKSKKQIIEDSIKEAEIFLQDKIGIEIEPSEKYQWYYIHEDGSLATKCITLIVKKSEDEVYQISLLYNLQNSCLYQVTTMEKIQEARKTNEEYFSKKYKDNRKIEVFEKIE